MAYFFHAVFQFVFLILFVCEAAQEKHWSDYKSCAVCAYAGYGWDLEHRRCTPQEHTGCPNDERAFAVDSPELPTSHYTELTRSNWLSVVYDPTKDVLVKFHAPWCGHCQKLAPIWNELAASFLREPSVVIARLDATLEKGIASPFNLKGYPTIKLFRKDNKDEPIEYVGVRNIQSLLDYINSNCGTNRQVGGKLNPLAGRIYELDLLAAQIPDGISSIQQVIPFLHETARKYTEAPNSTFASHYTKIAQRISEKGFQYVEKEYERVTKILLGGKGLSPEKQDEWTIKINVLRAFRGKNRGSIDVSQSESVQTMTKNSKEEAEEEDIGIDVITSNM